MNGMSCVCVRVDFGVYTVLSPMSRLRVERPRGSVRQTALPTLSEAPGRARPALHDIHTERPMGSGDAPFLLSV